MHKVIAKAQGLPLSPAYSQGRGGRGVRGALKLEAPIPFGRSHIGLEAKLLRARLAPSNGSVLPAQVCPSPPAPLPCEYTGGEGSKTLRVSEQKKTENAGRKQITRIASVHGLSWPLTDFAA